MSYDPSSNLKLNSVTSSTNVIIPKNNTILQVIVENTTALPVIGGLKVGTTSGGSDVVNAFVISGSGFLTIKDSALIKTYFSKTNDTTLYIDAVTAFNSTNLNFSFILRMI